MKSRVNSRINNTRGKHNYSLHVRKQGFKSESREKALGYCSHHQIYIGEKTYCIMLIKKVYDASLLVHTYVRDYLMGNLGETYLSIPKQNNKYVKAANCDDYFLFASAKDLCERISKSFSTREQIDELFINNVRGYLGENKKMKDTIESETEKTKFALYNNGVSICCQKVDDETSGFFRLKNPYVVNGQQTILTLYSAYENGSDLSNIEIPLFIKPYNDNERQMLDVAIYNNTQSPVKDIDLLCGDINVRKISKKILEIDYKKYVDKYESWLTLKMFSTGVNSNLEITSLVIPRENIIAVNDYFKILLPILFHFKNKDEASIDMHLESFNKNTTKYKDKYDELIGEIKEFLDLDTDFYYSIADCAKKAGDYVKKNSNYRPAENIFGIAFFYGISEKEVMSKLNKIGYDKCAELKDKISLLTKSEKCKELMNFFVENKKWDGHELK